MIPFQVTFAPGSPLFEQVVYAATKAIVSGRLRPGDDFPSVRVLSRELKINPNTAHKVVTSLVESGLLEVRPGSVPVVATLPLSSKAERNQLLDKQFEQLVVEAKRLGLDLQSIEEALAKHWARLSRKQWPKSETTEGGR
jgi:GntR family transcriptional regulator